MIIIIIVIIIIITTTIIIAFGVTSAGRPASWPAGMPF